MFVIERLFIEDKNLAKVLTALDGLVLNMEPPRPVSGATVKQGQVKATSENPGIRRPQANSRQSRLILWLKENPGEEISLAEMAAKLVELGGQASTMNGLINKLIKDGIVKRKHPGVYTPP
jgi:hypothetical protein